jgi:tRNA modification GTPase
MARVSPSHSDRDVIVAPATAPGASAVAIVRLSGPGTHELLKRLFRPNKEGRSFATSDWGRLVLGEVLNGDGTVIDRCLAVAWRAPRSYTGEDTGEFHLHGSPSIVQRVVESALKLGARPARPGEFTRRAFLNGRLDLAQAEAVGELVQAETEAAARAALGRLRGGLSHRLVVLRAELIPVLAELEATIDFPDEGIEASTRQRLEQHIERALVGINALLESFKRGRVLREGMRVVLAGPPNAGKSSLFNLLVGRERAIVSPHPGTTRDTVEAQVEIAGVAVTLVDTAGLRALPEEIEAMGIAKTHEEIQSAALVLFVVDSTDPGSAREEYCKILAVPHLLVFNKTDRMPHNEEESDQGLHPAGALGVVHLSTVTGAGFSQLEGLIRGRLGENPAEENNPLITSERHALDLGKARQALETVAKGIASALSPEFLALDLAEGLTHLDSITGRGGLDEEVLDAIFLQFCLGK